MKNFLDEVYKYFCDHFSIDETQMDKILEIATDEELGKFIEDFFNETISTESKTIIQKYTNETN